MDSSETDARLDFIGNYVQKALKLKSEKWTRLLSVTEYRVMITDFLEKRDVLILIISQNAAVQLVASNNFPVCLKNKAAYFVKKQRCSITKENVNQIIIFGDMATKPIEQLAGIVDEVFVPLLSNSTNQNTWAKPVTQDLKQHIHGLKNTVYQVKGEVCGQTILPMPEGLSKGSTDSGDASNEVEDIDLQLKGSIEETIIQWFALITNILSDDPSSSFANSQHPTAWAEIQYWDKRLTNLKNINQQLQNVKVYKMIKILETTNSAYYPGFKNVYDNVQSALEEAENVTLYLKPLRKHFLQLEDIDFSEIIPCIKPLMHVICLIWSQCKFYCNSARIITLLRQICNLFINQAKRYLDPSSIFQSDVDEAKQRIQWCLNVFKVLRTAYDEHANNLEKFFTDRPPILWTFDSSVIFSRTQVFTDRLNTIQWFFDTVKEFTKLERIEIGGLKGRTLGARIISIYREFNENFTMFSTRTYDVLDPEDSHFPTDYKQFQKHIDNLDRKLASVLCQAFDECYNLEAIFKLIDVIGSVMERPHVRQELCKKYHRIFDLLEEELKISNGIFNTITESKTKNNYLPVEKHLPPVATALNMSNSLRQRITAQINNFKTYNPSLTKTKRGIEILNNYNKIMADLDQYEDTLHTEWKMNVPHECEKYLQNSLLIRDRHGTKIALNFHYKLKLALSEVRYLQLFGKEDIPQEAYNLYLQEETFRKYITALTMMIKSYNKVRNNCATVEYELVKPEIENIDKLIDLGEHELTWKSPNLLEYVENLHHLVENLKVRIQNSQANVKTIQSILHSWCKVPVLERKDNKKDTMLDLEGRMEKFKKRYSVVSKTGTEIHRILDENCVTFCMDNNKNCNQWLNYKQFIDHFVSEAMLSAVGCSLIYIAENMDPLNVFPPLFEAKLELQIPDIMFTPSLETNIEGNFISLVQSIIEDVIHTTTLIPRIYAESNHPDYTQDVNENLDIISVKDDIMHFLDVVIKQAKEFSLKFESYSYLWLDDREMYMQQFLTYGRQLTGEEFDLILLDDASAPQPSAPEIDQFKEQIDNFENLYCEVQLIENVKVFNNWFQVDVQPFKQSLLNIVCKWSQMFKQHLVEHVTNSLTDLSNFIREADEGMLQSVEEGNYDALVNVMAYLMNVKERQEVTDEMFEPLKETIQLLKYYDQDLSEEVNVLLQELPEQWSNTKKIAVNVKQLVAPLQAAEVLNIRRKITIFDNRQTHLRDRFKKATFFKYDCPQPYDIIQEFHDELSKYETEMERIQASASLFEVNMPEFKQLKQSRRELRMLKQLWDYVYLVNNYIENWKKTPWRKVDVETMDIECKKFAKEIRGLDKEMRSWETYGVLEKTVKNMLTSLKAVSELQNPAIRERHWQQLMKSTKVPAIELCLERCFKKLKFLINKLALNKEKYLHRALITKYNK